MVQSNSVARLRQGSAELALISPCVPVQLFQHPYSPPFAFEFQLIRFFGELYSAGSLPARGRSIRAELWSLLRHTARFVQCGDGAPVQIAFRIEAPVGWNENHCAEWRQVHREFEKQWMIPAHSVKIPALTKHIEHRIETICGFRPAKWPVLTHAALGDESASNDAFVIGELGCVKVRFNRVPLRLERGVVRQFRLDLVVFVAGADQRLIVSVLNSVLVLGNGALGSLTAATTEADRSK